MLDDLSRSFGEALFARYPEWQSHARRVPWPEDGSAFLEIILRPPPGSGHAEPLWIHTDGEITVGFAGWHSHWPWPFDPEDIWANPLDVITGILRETTRVDRVCDGERTVFTSHRPAGSEEVSAPAGRVWTVETVSWKGTHNRRYLALGAD